MKYISELENEIAESKEHIEKLENSINKLIERGFPKSIIDKFKLKINNHKKEIQKLSVDALYHKKCPEFSKTLKEIEVTEILVDERTQEEREKEKEQLKRLFSNSQQLKDSWR